MNDKELVKQLRVYSDSLDYPEAKNVLNEAAKRIDGLDPIEIEDIYLNMDEYARVGDVMKCFDGMDFGDDASWHAFLLMRWAIAKRSVPLNTILKEHGPKRETFTVIDRQTGEVADMEEIALHEEWANRLCYCDMEGWALTDSGSLLLVDECGNFEYASRERFEVKWDE